MTKKSDIPFSDDASRYFVPWMSMLMVFIATLILSGALVAYSSIQTWTRNISGSLTIQIPTFDSDGKDRKDAVKADIETAVTILVTTRGVLGASVLSDEQMSSLMAPWIGENTDISRLPLPKLIDVSVDTNNPPDLTQLKADLTEQVPSAILDSHRLWLENLIQLATGMIKLVSVILVLLILSTAFTIIYATRTSLSVHQPVIALIHMMGANDFYISAQYAVRSFKQTLLGSLIGFVATLPIMSGFAYFLDEVTEDFIFNTSLTYEQWLILGSVPFIAAVLAFLTTFKTVSHYLKRFL